MEKELGKMDQKNSLEAISFEVVSKRYRQNLPLLESVSFSVYYGEVVALFGPSGSGKSTILQIACALILPDSGKVRTDGKEVFPYSRGSEGKIARLRSSLISYVPQDDYLFEALSVSENVALALELNGPASEHGLDPSGKVDQVLGLLGIQKIANRRISDISSGERRRVVIGRSLVTNPRILIADEPTSSLDLEATEDFLKLVREKSREQKTAFLIASHDVVEVRSIADKVYGVRNNTLVEVKS